MPPGHRSAHAVTMLPPGRTVLAGADLEYLPGFLGPADADELLAALLAGEIGRASCRERVSILVVAGSL